MKLSAIANNPNVQIAGALSIFIGPSLDALNIPYAYAFIGGIFSLLFFIGIVQEYNKEKRLKKELIHFPIVIKVDSGPHENYAMDLLLWNIEKEEHITNYKKMLLDYFHLDVESYVFTFNGDIFNQEELFFFMKLIRYKMNEVQKRLEGRVKFHIAYYRRPSIGFMLGTLFRTESIKIYQINDAKNIFEMVCDVQSRQYKEAVIKFQHYTIYKDLKNKNDQEVLLVINSASHQVNTNAKSLKRFTNKVIVTLNTNGTIPYDANWCEYCAEIYTVLNELQVMYKSITIAHAMPEALAVLLGMAIENYWNVSITQYKDQEYLPVFNMKEIKVC